MHYRFEGLWHEVRHGVRLLGRNSGFTIVAGLTLALGIGATSAIFSVLYATVLAPLPYPDPERLVWIQDVNAEGQNRGLSIRVIETIRKESRTLESITHARASVSLMITTPGAVSLSRFENGRPRRRGMRIVSK